MGRNMVVLVRNCRYIVLEEICSLSFVMENSTEVVENCGYNSSGGVLYSTFGDGEYDGSGGKLYVYGS